MKISGKFIKSIFSVFILSAVLILSRQLAPPIVSAGQNAPDEKKSENYDIRTDNGEAARAALEKYIAEAGKSAARLADERKRAPAAVEKLRAASGNLQIEFNEDLRVPEVIA